MTWIEPSATDVSADHWLTRRATDAAEGYASFQPDIRVQYRWSPSERAWVTGSYWTSQGYRASLSCLHSNNGWRLEEQST